MLYRYLLLFLFVVLAVSGCAEQKGKYIRDGKEYGNTSGSFRGRWWNYYERGRSFSDGKFYAEAIADYGKAIKGRDKDKWHARTYGMHFTDYFPHRELGVVYFQQQLYSQAIDELEYSIESAPSAKAHYFLNKARGARLKLDESDVSAPKVHIQGAQGKIITNSFSHTIEGIAEDDTYVASIKIGDKPVPLELAKKQHQFSTEISLQPGENNILMVVTDLVGKSTEQTLEILSDRSGPLVEILQVQDNGTTKVAHGVVSDDGGLRSLVINGNPWNISGAHSAYSFTFDVSNNITELVATDTAGNITKAILNDEDLEEDPLFSRVALLEPNSMAFANSEVASDIYSPLLASTKTPPADVDPPFIKLEDMIPGQVTYDEFVLLEGKALDFSSIHSLSIDGEPISNKNGKKLFFSHLKKLAEGKNEFIIVAIDVHGNRAEKKISIERKIQNIRRIGSRLSVAVLPFDHKGDDSPIGELIHDQMIDSFLEQKRFNVVERKKIEAVLRELKLSSTDLVDPDKAVDLGRIVAANTMLAGTVIESPDSVEIIGRLIDTETATIMASNDIFGEDKSFSSLDNLLDSLAFKFKRDFPIFEGILIEVKGGDEVLIDIGTEKQIKPNMHLICYRKGMEIKHPVTGKILGAEPEILGDITVKEVYEGFSKAKVAKKGEIKVYDQVISK